MDENKQKSPQGCVHSRLIDSLKENGMTLLPLDSVWFKHSVGGLQQGHTEAVTHTQRDIAPSLAA